MRLAALLAFFWRPAAAELLADDLPYPRPHIPLNANATVFVVLTANLSHSDQVTLQTLAGGLARNTPRIYTVDSLPTAPDTDDTTVLWMDELAKTIKFDPAYLTDFRGLLRHFAAEIGGYVRYDPQSGSTNAALIRCAAEPSAAVAVASNETAAFLASLGVPQLADVSSSTPLE